jgi:hypothetical protein
MHVNKKIILALIPLLVLIPSYLMPVPAAFATQPPGKLAYKINFIGVPRDTAAPGAEDGNGRRIFIPLQTTRYTDPCGTTGGQNNPDATADTVLAPTKGVKIKVSEGAYDIVDGDAVADKVAAFTMPADHYDVYIAAKGKPGGCLDLEAYTTFNSTLIFIGSIDIDRSTGKPHWQNVNNLLWVNGNGDAYFADPYQDYFWQIYNNGLRNMELRFYQTTA